MAAISMVRIVVCAVLGWFILGYWQQRFGNAAIIMVVIAGVAEIPLVVACLILLPKGSVGKTTLLNLARACIVSICTIVPISLLQPLQLWYLVPLAIVLFALSSLATRLIAPADLLLALDIARNGVSAFLRPKPQMTPTPGT